MNHPDLIGWSDGTQTYLTTTAPFSSTWHQDKQKAETIRPYKGTIDSCGGNNVYATTIDNVEVKCDTYGSVTVYSGYEPYSTEWYRDAEAQGVCTDEALAHRRRW